MDISQQDEAPTVAPTDPITGQDLSVSLAAANMRSIVFALPPVILIFALYVLLWGRPHISLTTGGILAIAGIFLAGVILHEAIHGLAWALWGTKSFSTIKFGINVRALAPYAHATVPMKASAYRLGAFGPAFVLGLVPSVGGLITGNLPATLFGIIFIAAAAGDFLVLWLIRKLPSDALVKDHPTRAGCVVLDASDIDTISSDSPHSIV
jgi:hypothetical protein